MKTIKSNIYVVGFLSILAPFFLLSIVFKNATDFVRIFLGFIFIAANIFNVILYIITLAKVLSKRIKVSIGSIEYSYLFLLGLYFAFLIFIIIAFCNEPFFSGPY